VDLSAEPVRTAVAVLEWVDGKAVVEDLRVGADDEAIQAALMTADKAGIDALFGWPDAFTAFLVAHQAGNVSVPGGLTGQQWRRQLAWRYTDETVRKKTDVIPLSVAADRIGHAAMRCAGLLARLGSLGSPVDRDGSGTVTEVYPAASLKQWGLPYRGYKQPSNPAALPDLVSELEAAAPWLDLGPRGSPEPDSPARSRTAGRSQPRRLDRASRRAAHRARVRGTSLDSSNHPGIRRIADSGREDC
jgi:hypothetical protein